MEKIMSCGETRRIRYITKMCIRDRYHSAGTLPNLLRDYQGVCDDEGSHDSFHCYECYEMCIRDSSRTEPIRNLSE